MVPIYKIKNLNPDKFQVNPFYQRGIKPDNTVEIINNWAAESKDLLQHF